MSTSEREHAVTISGYAGDLGALAIELGRMRYDAQAHLLQALAAEMIRQAAADRARGRPLLAARLDTMSVCFVEAADQMQAVWQLCRRHVGHELAKHPEIER